MIILSDMQTFGNGWVGNVTDAAPEHVPMYGFNLAGHQHAAMPNGTDAGGDTAMTAPVPRSARGGRHGRYRLFLMAYQGGSPSNDQNLWMTANGKVA